ncbi:MAG TPA: glucosidase [Polyangiaceae bacterium]|nr:glucosidase [Polyangiaceae bacterium]
MSDGQLDPERRRLEEARIGSNLWRKWGPYLSERQWGTVREDYSENGAAWDYFSHDQARSRAYLWGEDGIAGFSDDKQLLCFCLALWNGKDPILKERLFGLTNSEGNHGEDVKEYYFYLDSTPTHSYMRYLYKYPQAAYPYDQIVRVNRERSRTEPEYELLDTGVFDDDRYFDVFVEFAKKTPNDVLIHVTVCNRGPDAAELYLLPQLWFRNTWHARSDAPRPELRSLGASALTGIVAEHPGLGTHVLLSDRTVPVLFTENETNTQRVFGRSNATPYVKDAFHELLINGQSGAVNPDQRGTKAAFQHRLSVPARGETRVSLRLFRLDSPLPNEPVTSWIVRGLTTESGSGARNDPMPFGADFMGTFETRRREAHEFYASIMPARATEDERNVIRQALAGMLWSKQYYLFDLGEWLEQHGHAPYQGQSKPRTRNAQWMHMVNDDVISMPDKWEYPWYAAWDLAFHTVALDAVDPDFAKQQLLLMLRSGYLHPNGQVPAYEWNFGDVNPPVQCFAALYQYNVEKRRTGKGDIEFLRRAFQQLSFNFSWWANRKDPAGRNLFEGGFLGLDNIGVFDRSSKLPTGGYLEQADGTAWMALFCQNMFEMALELADADASVEDLASKFAQHFFWIAGSMDRPGDNEDELWDESEGFFYDLLHLPDGRALRLKTNSMVGLLPLCAVSIVEEEQLRKFPGIRQQAADFLRRRPELAAAIHPPEKVGVEGRRMLAICNEDKLRRILWRMLSEERFLSPHGIRSLSRWHKDHPYEFVVGNEKYTVGYMPAESDNGMFGGNSNWRGPVWFPINIIIIRALVTYYRFYGDTFKVECPTGSGVMMNLWEVACELSRRMTATFLRDKNGRRPVYGSAEKFQTDPHFRDLLLFYEYFHGDNGAGIGASHQTGWTGLVAPLTQLYHLDPSSYLKK